MDNQQRFIVGVSSGGRPIETASDHGFVVDHGELVMEFVATGESRNPWLQHHVSHCVFHSTKIVAFEDFASG